MKTHTDAQGTDGWLAARRGVITGSRFKDCRDKLKSGAPAKGCLVYAMDVARERCGGRAMEVYQNAAMRFGIEQEAVARVAQETAAGYIIEEAGFITTDDGIFGCSVDGLIGADGMWECKTLVSSDTLFTAVVEGDVSAYLDQINGALWLLGRKWCDLTLWAPDLAGLGIALTTRRITRDEAAIEALETDLMAFATVVRLNESKLRRLAMPANVPALLAHDLRVMP